MQTLKYVFLYLSALAVVGMAGFALADEKKGEYMGDKELTPQERYVIVDKGTERPFTGKYNDFNESGTYVCKRCGSPLYRSAMATRHCSLCTSTSTGTIRSIRRLSTSCRQTGRLRCSFRSGRRSASGRWIIWLFRLTMTRLPVGRSLTCR